MTCVPIIKVVCTCVGVALDDLVYICTKIARQMDSNGLSKVFDAAETATSAIEEARPLLENAVKLVDEVCLRSRSLCRTRVHTQLTLHYNLAVSQGNHDCAVAFTHVDLAVSTSSVVEQHCNMHVQEAMLYAALLCKFTVVSIFWYAMHLNSICVRAVHSRRQSCCSFWLMHEQYECF